MVDTVARASVKRLLDIESSITDFDDDIDEFVLEGVKRLYPFTQYEKGISSVTSFTINSGEVIINLDDNDLSGVRRVEAGDGLYFSPVLDYYHHANKLFLRGISNYGVSEIRLYGLSKFTLGTVYDYLERAVIYFAVSEFFNFLIGNKRKYNVYMSNGRASVDSMQDVAQYYEEKANQYLNDRATIYGGS